MTTALKTAPAVEDWLEKQGKQGAPPDLSIVVPAYNEEWRLPPTLVDMVDYLDAHNLNYEIIVVDDGSRDQTAEVVRKFERIRKQIRLIQIPTNNGKGYAVSTGVLNSHGRRVLFSDADGSTHIKEVERLAAALDKGADLAIGSRAMRSGDTELVTRWYRKLPGRVFNFCVNFILLPDFADTQCGFKLFSADAARFLFQHQQSKQFSFDIEILHLARQAGLKIAEVPVSWTHVPGSKVNLIVDSLKMLRDVVIFRFRHSNITPQSFADFTSQRTHIK